MAVASDLSAGLSPATQAQFRRLQQGFVAGLARRWLEIEGAANAQALQQSLHRLVGSAGSFGYTQIGECAREAESLAAGPPSAALAHSLARLALQLELAQSLALQQEPSGPT